MIPTQPRLSQTVRDRFLELRAEGASYDRISRELGVSKHTLINWGRRYAGTIASLQAIHLAALADEDQIVRRQRIEPLGRQLQIVRAELAARNLGDVSTPRLMDMLLKLTKAIAREIPEPEPAFADATLDETPAEDSPPDSTPEEQPSHTPDPPPTDKPSSQPPARTKSAPKFNLSSAMAMLRGPQPPMKDLQARIQAQNRAICQAMWRTTAQHPTG